MVTTAKPGDIIPSQNGLAVREMEAGGGAEPQSYIPMRNAKGKLTHYSEQVKTETSPKSQERL